MALTHHEVTYQGSLAAFDGGVERLPTEDEFSEVLWKLADELHEVAGLVDPGVWGQAATGKIEIDFGLDGLEGARGAAARAMEVVHRVGTAAGLGLCVDLDGPAQNTGVATPHRQGASGPRSDAGTRGVAAAQGVTGESRGCSCFVLVATGRISEAIPC